MPITHAHNTDISNIAVLYEDLSKIAISSLVMQIINI